MFWRFIDVDAYPQNCSLAQDKHSAQQMKQANNFRRFLQNLGRT